MNYKLIKYKDKHPKISDDTYLLDGVIIAGDVTIGKYSNIWFNSVIRGDVAPIIIGDNTNIQDGTVIHTSRFNNGATILGNNITVGHMALLHACTIEDNAFIGMQSTIMDGSIIESFGFVGAGSLLTNNSIVKKNELWLGRPAKYIRMITDKEKEFMQENYKKYVNLAKDYIIS